MGTLYECLREARLEKYYPSFRARGITKSEALTRLTIHDCPMFGISSAEDKRRLVELISIIKDVHNQESYYGGQNTRSSQQRTKSPRKRNRSPAHTQIQAAGRGLAAVGDVRVHDRSRTNASSHHISSGVAGLLDLVSDEGSSESSSSDSTEHSDYEPAVKHSVTGSVQQSSPPTRIRKTTVEKVKHDGYNYGVPGSSAGARPKSRGMGRLGEEKIKVCIRKRPLSRKEIKCGEEDMTRAVSTTTLTVTESKQAVDLTAYTLQHEFIFDEVFEERCTNEDVYIRAARPLVSCIFDGGSATIFAYGQTGAGKTYTMIGDREVPGLYLLASHDIFSIIESGQYGADIKVWISFFEIYCGQLFDLLNKRNRLHAREDGAQRVCIAGLTETEVRDESSLMQVLEYGNAVRSKGSTGVNPDSSRSHAVLQLEIRDTNDKRMGRMSFIDLAGSERASDSTDSDKQTRMEGAEINQSLLALKECIRSIDQESRHKPFRQSKLTHILKDSFIGNSRTCMIANISPARSSCEHTLNTLRYADRVKELRRAATSASTSKSVNVAMSNILMNIPPTGPSLFQPSNILCSSTPMRHSTKSFTNKNSSAEIRFDPNETPIRGPGGRRKTSSSASRSQSQRSSVASSVASRVSVVRHVSTPQTPPPNIAPAVSHQNDSSHSESDQTDTDSNNVTGPQKPFNQIQNILPSKPAVVRSAQNIPVVKSTDTENDFPTTDFNNEEEMNDLNRTDGKSAVAASVPAFPSGLAQQTDPVTNKAVVSAQQNPLSGVGQYPSVFASVPVLRQKVYTGNQSGTGSTDNKREPVVNTNSDKKPAGEAKRNQNDVQKWITDVSVADMVRNRWTSAFPMSSLSSVTPNVQSAPSVATKKNLSRPTTQSGTGVAKPVTNVNATKITTNNGPVKTSSVASGSTSSHLKPKVTTNRTGDIIKIPTVLTDSFEDDLLFDPPSIDTPQRPRGTSSTSSESSSNVLSPNSSRRVPQDTLLQPEVPAVLPAKSSDLTTFSQRSPRYLLQNKGINHELQIHQPGRPDPVRPVPGTTVHQPSRPDPVRPVPITTVHQPSRPDHVRPVPGTTVHQPSRPEPVRPVPGSTVKPEPAAQPVLKLRGQENKNFESPKFKIPSNDNLPSKFKHPSNDNSTKHPSSTQPNTRNTTTSGVQQKLVNNFVDTVPKNKYQNGHVSNFETVSATAGTNIQVNGISNYFSDTKSNGVSSNKSGTQGDQVELISANWFLTPADHDTHVSQSVSQKRTCNMSGDQDNDSSRSDKDSLKSKSDKSDRQYSFDQMEVKEIDEDYLPLHRNSNKNQSAQSDSGVSSAVSEIANKSNNSKSGKDDRRQNGDMFHAGYFSDSGARSKFPTPSTKPSVVHSPQKTREAFNNSPVFKEFPSTSPLTIHSMNSNSSFGKIGEKSSSPFEGKTGNSVIKTEKITPGAVFSPIHPQPVTDSRTAKSTTAVSKDILHPTPVSKVSVSADTRRGSRRQDSSTDSEVIDLKSQLISAHEDQLATVTSLCKQEMKLLLGAKAGNKTFDEYMQRVSHTLCQKMAAIQLLQDQIIAYQLSTQDSHE